MANAWLITALFLALSSRYTVAWDSDDLEVFDVVEEVGENFYTLLNIPKDATASDIKKAFRKLSLQLHPDKNPAPDAEVKFRNLVSVYEILKDPKKRAKYGEVLENGLPDWKHAIYYYRRVRKMGLIEMSIILFVIITIGQYLTAWAAYFERRYAVQEFINTKKKSLERKQKRGKIEHGTVEMLPEMLVSSIPRPTVACTLPVQIVKFVWFLVVQAPPLSYQWLKDYIKTRNERVESEDESSEEERPAPIVRERGPRRRKGGFQAPELGPEQHSATVTNNKRNNSHNQEPPAPAIKGGLWTDDDFDDLIRLMKKYPAGTQDRWEKIGEAMRRAGTEVAHMAHKIKDEGFNPFKQGEEAEEPVGKPKKTKTRKPIDDAAAESGWTQMQQKALETALAKFPKNSASGDRWEVIANCVPGKTKEECMIRYKHLADLVKKKKENQNSTENGEELNLCSSHETNSEQQTIVSS